MVDSERFGAVTSDDTYGGYKQPFERPRRASRDAIINSTGQFGNKVPLAVRFLGLFKGRCMILKGTASCLHGGHHF